MPAGGGGRATSGSGGPGSGSARSGGPAAGGTGRGGSGKSATKPKPKPAAAPKAGTASPSGGRGATPRPPGARVGNAPANLPKRPTAKQAERGRDLMKNYDSSRTPGNAGANRPRKPTAKQWESMNAAKAAQASPKGRMSRVDSAVQARASAIAGRASSAFKRVPGSSRATTVAKRTGATSVKAYNKLPGGKKTKMATATGIGGGAVAVGAGMYADRNKGKPGSGKPKNGDTKKIGGRNAIYRNGSWYSS